MVRYRTEAWTSIHENHSTPNQKAAPLKLTKGNHMTSLKWIGIIVWGFLITCFGLASAGPVSAERSADIQPHDVMFLVVGGLVTCLIGFVGLVGFMGWVPGLRKVQKSVA
jgi:hypothetical protein